MATQPNHIRNFDTAYNNALDAIEEFFRYAKRHPDATAELNERFDDAYYGRVAEVFKNRINHELKHLHSTTLD
jgi:hypothetical protein